MNCSQPFVHSFVSFEVLPLVEFQLEDGISDLEALRLIETDARREEEEEDVMRLGEETANDPFTTKLLTFHQDGLDFTPVVATRALLQSLAPGEVRIVLLQSLAPGEVRIILIQSLAPVEVRIVLLQSMAPGEVRIVLLQSLAPGEVRIVLLQSLAPGEVRIVLPQPLLTNSRRNWLDRYVESSLLLL